MALTDDPLAQKEVAADLPRDSTGRELARAAYARLFGGAGDLGPNSGEEPISATKTIGDERQAPGFGASPELARGTLVGRYLLLAKIGKGGMGVVYAAHDPELDRKVALKLLLPERADSCELGRARLLGEAQALAKLSHPNVVTVHDVGVHLGQVWIAMEFVSGQTLREWLRGGRRTWPEVLRVLTDVARGVVAAHAVELIHRDLKPDNVMIGSDGRVRVMDFGLARDHSLASADQELASTAGFDNIEQRQPGHTLADHVELAAVARRLTRPGAIQGTPAYMGPEQWRGQEAEAATDQFGWSVMGWEALYGERPYSGASVAALATAVLLGRRRPVPSGRRVPAWLRRIVERGLADEPAHRWPTMQDLLSALERGKARARTRLAALVLTVFAAVALLVGVYRWWDRSQRILICESTGAAVDGIWDDAARDHLRAAFSAAGPSYATTTASKVIPWLDKQARAWKRERKDACLRADVDGSWDRDTVERALWCLEERQLEFRALVEEFGQANARTVQKAVAAATNLRAPGECTDASVLAHQPVPPSYDHEALAAVRAHLSRAHILGLSGNYKDALATATAARERAQEFPAWPRLWATARALEGSLLEDLGEYPEAETASREAYFEAFRLSAWDLAMSTASTLIFTVGHQRARHDDGLLWAEHAKAMAVHAGDPLGLREADRLNSLGLVQQAAADYASARQSHEQALELRRRALGDSHPHVAASMGNLGQALESMGSYARAQEMQEAALAIFEGSLGPTHPSVAQCLYDLADVHAAMGDLPKARALHERALAIRQEALGPEHPDVATSTGSLANVYEVLGMRAEAKALYKHSVALLERSLGPDHPYVAASLANLAQLHQGLKEYVDAKVLFGRALAIFEKALGADHPDVAQCLGDIANVHYLTGDYATARPLQERALAISAKALGPNHPRVAISLVNLAKLDNAERAPRSALPRLERAVNIMATTEGVGWGESEAHFELAKTIVAIAGDRARALDEARIARDGYATTGESAAQAEVEQWLARFEGHRYEGRVPKAAFRK